MSREKLKRARSLRRRRSPGQSIPLIAIMIVVLVAMVGLSVDVGNTFQTERQAVSAANAASLAGMNTYLRRTASTTNQSIYNSIVASLNSNGVEVVGSSSAPQNEQLQLEAYYLDAQGEPLASEGNSPRILPNGALAPRNAAYIQVNLDGNVDTYFARVVNRNDLPVNATSYAGACPAGEGIYPIGINSSILEGNKFADPGDRDPVDGTKDKGWRTVRVDTVTYTAMRVELQNGADGKGFAWLRWQGGVNSADALAAGLTIPGTLLQGFEEADWPDTDKPADYPGEPGFLTLGDWVYGTTASGAANARIDAQRADGTRMVLPIFDLVQGTGDDAQYRVSDFGIFVVNGQGNDPATGTKFLDLTFVGRDANQKVACSYSAAPDPTPVFNLAGDVEIRPEYGYVPNNRKPIQYVVVLDVSGSMSANFAGQCNASFAGSGNWQCTNGPVGAPGVNINPFRATGPDYWWGTESERRIRVAKDAIASLIRVTNMQGNGDQYDINRPVDQMSIVWFRDKVNSGDGNITKFTSNTTPSPYFSSNPTELTDKLRTAGRLGSDNYRTQGGTNGAAGLYRAALAYNTVPKTVPYNGKTWEYKRVVIFITDGVSNSFLSRSNSELYAGSSNQRTWPPNHPCYDPRVIEIATCQVTGGGGQTTGIGGVAANMDRPITQAGQVSRADLQANGAEVFAIALSNIPATGLQDTIASFPSHFASAETLVRGADGKTNVDKIMLEINTKVEGAPCEPRSDLMDQGAASEFRGTIPAGHFPSAGVPLPDLGITLVYPHVGNVLLVNRENNVSYTVPIMADPATGVLRYSKSDLPRGDYKFSAYVFYKHPLDLPSAGPRMYGNIVGADESNREVIVPVGTGGGNVGLGKDVEFPVQLKLTGAACSTTP